MLKFIVRQDICLRFWWYPDIYLSQGIVATHLRCGGIFNDYFIKRLLMSPKVKKN